MLQLLMVSFIDLSILWITVRRFFITLIFDVCKNPSTGSSVALHNQLRCSRCFPYHVPNDLILSREVLGAHSAPVRTRLSKGLLLLAMSFAREGYSVNKFIACREEVYDDFSRQP